MIPLPKPKVPYTYEAYRLLPDDGRRWELIEGRFYVTPAPTSFHQTVSRRLQYELMTQLERKGLAYVFDAPIDVIFHDHTVVQPDLAVVAAENRRFVSERGIDGQPDLVVEILSPSTRDRDRILKMMVYAEQGVPEYWVVDTDRACIEVYVRGDDGIYALHQRAGRADTVRSVRFPEVAIPLAPIFEPL